MRVGFLLDDLVVSHYVAEIIKFVEDEKTFEGPVLITGYKNNSNTNFFKKIIKLFKKKPIKIIDKLLQVIFLKLILKIESSIVNKTFPNFDKKVDLLKNKKLEIIDVKGKWSKSGLFLDFEDDDISRIISKNLDCIIRCGSGIIKGKILNVPKHGIISFHHGDNRVNRGGPSGFWEVLNEEASTGFIIQRLNKELDGGEVLFRGNLMTKSLWLVNNAQLLEKANFFLMRLLKDVSVKKSLPAPEGVRLHGNKLYKIDSSKILGKYIIKVLAPKVLRKFQHKFFSGKITRWSVAYAAHNNFSKSLWRYHEVENPRGRFLADPFVFSKGGNDFIFVEDFFWGCTR
tara:strand:+ start:19070 stop:20098 length:1029 start_codon:yes stop_codon:yes gene_type:complete